MGIPVLILGKSGSGKSTSLRTFEPDEVGVLNVAGKPLPFRRGREFKKVENATYEQIAKSVMSGKKKVFAIDDSQYLMAFESFKNAKVVGYGKFTDMAVNFYNMVRTVTTAAPPDEIVYFLHHLEDTPTGEQKAKTLGKMLDDQLVLEGLFSIVLVAKIVNGQHKFITKTDGTTPAKAPMEMFESEMIDNDLYFVDSQIRDYYGFEPLRNEEDVEND